MELATRSTVSAIYPFGSGYSLSSFTEAAGDRRVPDRWRAAKRAIDVVVAATVLVLASPVMLLAAIAIVLTSGTSPIFVQERVGQFGRRFSMYKFRTMVNGAHRMQEELRDRNEASGPVFKMKRDPRVTIMGSILRKTSIDELPNLFNVLRGDMSLVGPRPALPGEVEYYDDFALLRLRAKPGITCLWQVCGRSSVDFETWMRLDNQYLETWTPLEDLWILCRTVPAVLSCRGAH
jgi:lipopolysaccharide/colanic/teichoic acid biosynthesis glycosyltransferase